MTRNRAFMAAINSHLLEFLDATRRRADGAGVPAFVERELRDFLAIGPLWRLSPRTNFPCARDPEQDSLAAKPFP